MFIDTITSIKDSKRQEKFDSRVKVNKVVEEVMTTLDEKEIKKIKSIIDLYNRNQMVYCKVQTLNENILGVPVKLKDKVLTIKTNDSFFLDIEINKVLNIEIIHF